jgi:hypothetical protein
LLGPSDAARQVAAANSLAPQPPAATHGAHEFVHDGFAIGPGRPHGQQLEPRVDAQLLEQPERRLAVARSRLVRVDEERRLGRPHEARGEQDRTRTRGMGTTHQGFEQGRFHDDDAVEQGVVTQRHVTRHDAALPFAGEDERQVAPAVLVHDAAHEVDRRILVARRRFEVGRRLAEPGQTVLLVRAHRQGSRRDDEREPELSRHVGPRTDARRLGRVPDVEQHDQHAARIGPRGRQREQRCAGAALDVRQGSGHAREERVEAPVAAQRREIRIGLRQREVAVAQSEAPVRRAPQPRERHVLGAGERVGTGQVVGHGRVLGPQLERTLERPDRGLEPPFVEGREPQLERARIVEASEGLGRCRRLGRCSGGSRRAVVGRRGSAGHER